MERSHRGDGWRVFVSAMLVAFAISFTAAPVAAAEKPDATELEKVRAYVQPSIVYLDIQWTGYVVDTINNQVLKWGEPFTLAYRCSGYVVNPNGYIATAGHCVLRDAELIESFKLQGARWALENGYYQNPDLTVEDVIGGYSVEPREGTDLDDLQLDVVAAWGIATSGVKTGQQYNARVVDAQPFDKGDHALLKVEAKNLQALPLAGSEPEVGQEVVSVGYPASVDAVTDPTFSPSYKDGSISSKKTTGGGQYNAYEISAAVSGGMSGGPTVDLDHKVIGVNSFGIVGEPQAFNFIKASSLLRELLADAGVKNTLGPISRDYFAGLDAYFNGDRDEAIELLQKVLDEQPSNEMAQEFIKKARALDEGSNLLPILLTLAAVALAGGAVATTMRRRRTPATATATQAAATFTPQPALTQSAPDSPSAGAGTTTATPEHLPADGAETSTRPKFCPSCGDPVQDEERFCSNCGEPVPSA